MYHSVCITTFSLHKQHSHT